ncbi:putative pre-mRNA-splicing factor ATP-dependent RNA helicase [Hortaea werneckii]|nr:putative pre-mRNA-splicing factor ATP-dependent RNA helicase [Hortaea werneckii]KAI7335374.1 putative pre-mRNA-splicing factor ATP-dependent RNA helicase [Hortaea werneckii]
MSSPGEEVNPRTNKPYSAHCQAVRDAARYLPVSQQIDHIRNTVKQNAVTIVVGETGSGKTTQVPQALLETLQDGMSIAVTQTRRLAAEMVAKRTAEELDDKVGGLVGLRHRDIDQIDQAKSRLHIITDGSLFALAKNDRQLSKYSIIVVDEAHEHTCATDLLLGLLKDLLARRGNSLKVVIMSATIDTDSFRNFFAGSAVVEVPGRAHPVTVNHLPKAVSSNDVTQKIVDTILSVHRTGRTGNILVFASGVDQINQIVKHVKRALFENKRSSEQEDVGALDIFELYAALPAEDQETAVNSPAPPPRNGKVGRKLIVSTNVAETSITVADVTYVIDSCRVKSKVYNPENESYTLQELWISKAQAQQRSGRAGRTCPGVAYRMCTETGYSMHLTDYVVPDLQNGDMLRECLDILSIGHNPINFPYIFPPATETIVKALGILHRVKAVRLSNQLTRLELTSGGELVAKLPVAVFSAVAILESIKFKCSGEMMMMVSMIEAIQGGSSLWSMPKTPKQKTDLATSMHYFGINKGGHIMLINVFLSWKNACRTNNVDQWLQEHQILAATIPPKGNDRKSTPVYETVRHGTEAKVGDNIQFDEGRDEWIIYHEFSDKGQGESFLRLVTPVPLELILRSRPDYWSDVEFMPAGHIQEALVKKIAELTGEDESTVRGGMPPPTELRTE